MIRNIFVFNLLILSIFCQTGGIYIISTLNAWGDRQMDGGVDG
jgi:hypothetical protein